MNIRQTLASPIGDLAAAGFKGRKPGSGSKIKGLNSQGLLDAAKKMWGNIGGDFNIHMERAMKSEAPHMVGPMKFDSLTKTQRRNVAKNMYSTAQQRARAEKLKMKASPGAGIYGGGPGSGPHPGLHDALKEHGYKKDKDSHNMYTHKKTGEQVRTQDNGEWKSYDKEGNGKKEGMGEKELHQHLKGSSVKAGGPGSGPHKMGESTQDPSTSGRHEVKVTYSDPSVNKGKKFTRTTTVHGPDKETAEHMLHTKYRNAGYTVHSGGPGSGRHKEATDSESTAMLYHGYKKMSDTKEGKTHLEDKSGNTLHIDNKSGKWTHYSGGMKETKTTSGKTAMSLKKHLERK